jgi:hypothetical protein
LVAERYASPGTRERFAIFTTLGSRARVHAMVTRHLDRPTCHSDQSQYEILADPNDHEQP